MRIKKIAQTPGLVATVVDNLNSDSDKNALSARQGKQLKKMIDDIEISGGSGGGSGTTTIINDALPIGSIVPYTNSTIPENWFICEGQAISRTEYSELFEVIGTTYGAGDGSTTFNLPNLKGRVPVGKDSSDSDFDTLGKTGGEKTHKLTQQEIPNYIIAHAGVTWAGGNNGSISYHDGYNSWYGERTLQTGGGDKSHNNLQPYITLNYIIKAKQTEGGSSSKLDSEVAISDTVPTRNEKLWVNPEEEGFDVDNFEMDEIEEIIDEKVEEQTKIEITTGQEFATNEYIDGKRVYGTRINCGNLNSGGIKHFFHGITFNEIIRVDAFANGGGYFHPLPYVSVSGMGEISEYSMCLCIDHNEIYLAVGRDRSDLVAIVTLYYTKPVSPTPV